MVAGTPRPLLELRTERLLLRAWRDSDREPFAAINADPVVMEHFPSTLSRDESDDFVDRVIAGWAERGFGLWAVEVTEPEDDGPAGFVGHVGLLPAEHRGRGAVEIGWRLAREAWGRGYAPEAARAALGVGFDSLGLDEVISFTVPQNANSRRVMDKIGMTHRPERDFDHPSVDPLTDPHLVRHVLYSITADEWAALATGR